ncbi:MAG: prephenate dehydrogenase/arogenate dehydrogenase family protein [Gammaproteobacteria bacterium]|nr:prephenate dehydrogenase/arogenate dehydrogenase family protein [Gammaproteobacteria bacterium]
MNKVCIVGVGLIGGSLAKAMIRSKQATHVVGFGRDAQRLQAAQNSDVITGYTTDIKEALNGADMVVIATPVGSFEAILKSIQPHVDASMVITDVGSTKASVIKVAESVFGSLPSQFVPAHPIAGKEKSGFEASDGDLFVGRKVIITPTESSSAEAVEAVKSVWQATGATVDMMSAASHDELLAMTSHLPHMLAFSIMNYLISQHPSASLYAAGGFRDFSRIASGDPIMWRDICLNNKEAIVKHIKGYRDTLDNLIDVIENENTAAIETLFRDAKSTRDQWLV